MLSRWFEKKPECAPPASIPGLVGPRVPRRSGGWAELRKRFLADAGLSVLDIGYTSSPNINYITGLSHSVFLADLVHEACAGQWQSGADEEGNPLWNAQGFIEQSLDFRGRAFDVALLWTTLDYLPEPLIAPVVAHLFANMNPGGQVLAYFHTRMQGEETAHCRFHVTAEEDVDMQLARPYPILRTFTSRSIEQLFVEWAGHRKFLAQDSLLEVILTR